MIFVDLKPDKSEPNREESGNDRLNPVNFEIREVLPPKIKKIVWTKEMDENACSQQ
jgi:hypothetical protein